MLSLHLLSAAHGAWQIHDGRLQVRTDVLDGFDEGGSKSKGPQRQPSVYKGFQDSAAAPVDPNVDPFAAYGEEDLSSNSDIEF